MSVVAPVLATGNTAVVIAAQDRPLPAVTLAEVLATSDVPGGVLNVLTGFTAELAPWLAAHRDVNALDLTGAAPAARAGLRAAAADNGQARLRAARDGLVRRTRPVPPARIHRGQDRLASRRGLTARAVAFP